jgi:hypothetical protein
MPCILGSRTRIAITFAMILGLGVPGLGQSGAGAADVEARLTDVQQCVPFIYGGGAGNANNFETLKACKRACPE